MLGSVAYLGHHQEMKVSSYPDLERGPKRAINEPGIRGLRKRNVQRPVEAGIAERTVMNTPVQEVGGEVPNRNRALNPRSNRN